MTTHSQDHSPARVDVDRKGAGAGSEPHEARLLLRLLVELQEREHRYVTDVLHDGPMQEFTAVLLALGRLRTTLDADAGEQLATIEDCLREAVTSLHRPPSAFRPGNGARDVIEMALAQRVQGLLADDVVVDVDVDVRPPTRAELPVLLAVVQLMLLAGEPSQPVTHAAVAVRSGTGGVELTLRAVPARPPGALDTPGTTEAARIRAARLRVLADAVGAQVECDPGGGAWRAVLRLP